MVLGKAQGKAVAKAPAKVESKVTPKVEAKAPSKAAAKPATKAAAEPAKAAAPKAQLSKASNLSVAAGLKAAPAARPAATAAPVKAAPSVAPKAFPPTAAAPVRPVIVATVPTPPAARPAPAPAATPVVARPAPVAAKAPVQAQAPAGQPTGDVTVGFPDLLVGGSDADFRDFVADLFAAASGMQAIRRSLAKTTGLTGSEIAVLLAVRRLSETGIVSVRAIAEHLHVAGAHATTEVAKLVEAGFVTKQEDAKDSRAVDIRLSPEGRRRLDRLTPLVRRVNDVLFDGLTKDEMGQVAKFLRRIILQSVQAAAKLDK